ncbi:MAG: peptidase C14 caspase catalytic subunit p20 [Saprospiraceae bacterium]|nr:peptidase C14 caspase catalytic subunit p20 [Saprospiraceae bacterium]
MKKILSILLFLCFLVYTIAAQQCIKGNCVNGEGTMVYPSGAKYIGSFKDGKIEGKGILYFSNGNQYAGEWKNQYRQGKGRMVFENGDEYFGDFYENSLQGSGRMKFSNGDVYDGEWRNGKPNGDGKYIFTNGDVYEGQMKEGLLEGYGIIRYADGSSYKGNWKGSLKNGKGVLITALGDVVEDEWIDDRLVKELFGDTTTKDTENFNFPDVNRDPAIKIWAVVVGIGSYEHMPSLRFTDDDAYQFFAFLKSPEGGALPETQLRVLIDENATYRNIIYTMRRVLMQADDNDVVLFYFSGHGFEESFVPVDYDGSRNLLMHDEVRKLVDASQAKHKIIIADACHSGGYAYKSLDATVQRFYRAFENSKGGTVLLLSSKEKEYSLEDGGLRSGVFSYFVVKGMKGEADENNDRLITVQELYDYTKKNVRHYTANMQTPLLLGDFDPSTPISVIRH